MFLGNYDFNIKNLNQILNFRSMFIYMPKNEEQNIMILLLFIFFF